MTPEQRLACLELECARFETDERAWESRYAVHVDRMHRILYGDTRSHYRGVSS